MEKNKRIINYSGNHTDLEFMDNLKSICVLTFNFTLKFFKQQVKIFTHQYISRYF